MKNYLAAITLTSLLGCTQEQLPQPPESSQQSLPQDTDLLGTVFVLMNPGKTCTPDHNHTTLVGKVTGAIGDISRNGKLDTRYFVLQPKTGSGIHIEVILDDDAQYQHIKAITQYGMPVEVSIPKEPASLYKIPADHIKAVMEKEK